MSTTYERRHVCFLISDHNTRILTQIRKFQIDKRNKLKNKRKVYRRIIRLFVLLGLNCIVRRTIHVKCVWVFSCFYRPFKQHKITQCAPRIFSDLIFESASFEVGLRTQARLSRNTGSLSMPTKTKTYLIIFRVCA